MSDKKVSINCLPITLLIVLFYNFDGSDLDLYDAVVQFLIKGTS